MKKIIILFTFILLSFSIFSQSNDKYEKIGIYYSNKIIKDCNSSPDELEITVDSCSNQKIWTTITWRGDYSTIKYKMKLYMEVDKNKAIVFYKEYDKTLIKRGMGVLTVGCIDLNNTKEIKSGSSIKFYPYKEFENETIE